MYSSRRRRAKSPSTFDRVRRPRTNDEDQVLEFNLRELAGSMGDFGTLFPFAIGYIAVNGLDPAGSW
jgi:hypothetical protein